MLDNSQKPNPILVIRSVMVKRPHCDQQTQKMGIRDNKTKKCNRADCNWKGAVTLLQNVTAPFHLQSGICTDKVQRIESSAK